MEGQIAVEEEEPVSMRGWIQKYFKKYAGMAQIVANVGRGYLEELRRQWRELIETCSRKRTGRGVKQNCLENLKSFGTLETNETNRKKMKGVNAQGDRHSSQS